MDACIILVYHAAKKVLFMSLILKRILIKKKSVALKLLPTWLTSIVNERVLVWFVCLAFGYDAQFSLTIMRDSCFYVVEASLK